MRPPANPARFTAASLWFFGFVGTLAPIDKRLILAFVVVGLASGSMHAKLPGLTAALFPTAIRQSGFAFPYSIGTTLFTGLTPLTLAWLVRDYGLSAPFYQYMTACVVTLVVAVLVRFMPLHLGKGTPGEVERLATRMASA